MPDDRPIYCVECDTEVQLYQNENGTLVVCCECPDKRRSVRVAKANPEGWA